ncbi:MAG: DNA-directed RNA polymerase subunit alpha C-terminal domain-containing protein [Gemmatimonas sp.]
MITQSDRQLPTSYDNQVQAPDAASLLAIWLEEDLQSLRSQREELDARILRIEQRLSILHDRETPRSDAEVGGSALVASQSPVVTATVVPRRSIMSLRLETRTHNALTKAGVASFAQLVGMTAEELRALPGFGAGCLQDLEGALERVHVTLPRSSDNLAANAILKHLDEDALRTIHTLNTNETLLSASARALLTHALEAEFTNVATASGFTTPELLKQITATLVLLQRASEQKPVSLLPDIALNLIGVSDSDLAVTTRYLGLDGTEPETLEAIGEREGVTRERIRQRVTRFRQSAAERRPLLLLVREAVGVLQRLNKPVTMPEWCAALPSWLSGTRPADLLLIQTLESFGWVDANSWHESSGITFVMAGAKVTAPIEDYQSRYEEAIALHYRFGVICADDLRQVLDITEAAADGALRADERWSATGNGWFLRTTVAQSWIARRVVEVLNGVKSVAIEPLYQSIKRIATHKFLEQGCRMPSRSLLIKLVQELRFDGVRFDIVHEIASVDAPVHDRELSGTTQAILQAFGQNHRALTGAEMSSKFGDAGLSEASAQVALSTSPLVTKLERGIYGLVGRHADMREIASARLRREAGTLVVNVEV